MEPKRRSYIENKIDEVYEIIVDTINKRDPRPTETMDMSPQAKPEPATPSKKLKKLIRIINDSYENKEIDEVTVVREKGSYSVILGIAKVAFQLYDPSTFCDGEQIEHEALEEKANQGLYLRQVSFENRYFQVLMSDAAAVEEVIIMTRNVKPIRRKT